MPIAPVPPEPAHVARAAFPKGNRYLRLAAEWEAWFTENAFLALLPTHGHPAQPPLDEKGEMGRGTQAPIGHQCIAWLSAS